MSRKKQGLYHEVSYNQEAVNFKPISDTGAACASCRFFKGLSCGIVTGGGVGEYIISGLGICDKHEHYELEVASSEVASSEVASSEVASSEVANDELEIAAGQGKPKSVIEKMMGLFRKQKDKKDGAFQAVGNGYWIAAYTNNFEDSDGEIISKKAHKDYINRVKLGIVPYPELWTWHIKGTAHGEAIWLDMIDDHMIVAIGKFSEDEAGKNAEKHYLNTDHTYKLSHGFTYPKWGLKDGVYEAYNTFEISTLREDLVSPANPYTTWQAYNGE